MDAIDEQLKAYFMALPWGHVHGETKGVQKMGTIVHIVHEGVPPGEEGRTVFITVGERVITLQPSDNCAIHLNGDNENGLPQTAQISTTMLQPMSDTIEAEDIGAGISDEGTDDDITFGEAFAEAYGEGFDESD